MRNIEGGLYLVVDPMPGLNEVLPKVKAALEGGVDVIQLWDHWSSAQDHERFVLEICRVAHDHHVPVIVHQQWKWLKTLPLDGVHFDSIPEDLEQIKKEFDKPFLVGLTCGNDEDKIEWAIENKIDYISFCSMFSSPTSNSCELVNPEIVRKTRAQTKIPIYVAGGITLRNASSLLDLGINGMAIVSGIMKAEDPKFAAYQFKQRILRVSQSGSPIKSKN
ncbi:MAG TPA: thiamine phosphate synthase [Ohtaekwangia sp.]|nr:thiamine phosphate synthase [Ohtaekwangia sp.]